MVLKEDIDAEDGGCMGKSKRVTVNPIIKKNMVAAESDSSDRLSNRSSEGTFTPKASASQFDAVIWLGDFNYRINGCVGTIVHAIQ